jgi:hypothetical protein
VLLANGRKYPPKYVLALAAKHATGNELPSDEFSGGEQTNSILRTLGYEIEPINAHKKARQTLLKTPRPKRHPAELPARRGSNGHSVVTVVLEKEGYGYALHARVGGMAAILAALVDEVPREAVVLFPGGWFKAGSEPPAKLLRKVERDAAALLRRHNGRFAVSFGLDGRRTDRGTLDQLGIAMTAEGISGIGRKFFRAPGEEPDLAPSWDAGEEDRPRIVSLFGKRYYLAVCYDAFGIKKLGNVGASVDAVLDHVHGFGPKGEGDSGDVLFARHGFAGAALAWGVPVFGGATFFNRPVPRTWPSGVAWRGAPASTMSWTYARNGLVPVRHLDVEVPEGMARLRVFGPW